MVAQKDIFHRVEIGRFIFAGVAGNCEPYITRLDDKMSGDVQLGPAEVQYLDGSGIFTSHPYTGPGYYVAKYGNQPRIALPGMTEGQAEELAAHFGMQCGHKGDYPLFWESPAGRGLLQWSRENPRTAARRAAASSYLPGWKAQLDLAA
jgi:hypothetical protein